MSSLFYAPSEFLDLLRSVLFFGVRSTDSLPLVYS